MGHHLSYFLLCCPAPENHHAYNYVLLRVLLHVVYKEVYDVSCRLDHHDTEADQKLRDVKKRRRLPFLTCHHCALLTAHVMLCWLQIYL